MRHPFENVRKERRALTLIPTVVITLALLIALLVVGAPLTTAATPLGIVDLELCRSAACAEAVLAAWGAHGRLVAAFTIGLDYAFLLAYGSAVAMAAIFAAPPSLVRVARVAAWAAMLASLLDAVENTAMWRVLDGDPSWAVVAGATAPPKFALVGAAMLFALVAYVVGRSAPRGPPDARVSR